MRGDIQVQAAAHDASPKRLTTPTARRTGVADRAWRAEARSFGDHQIGTSICSAMQPAAAKRQRMKGTNMNSRPATTYDVMLRCLGLEPSAPSNASTALKTRSAHVLCTK